MGGKAADPVDPAGPGAGRSLPPEARKESSWPEKNMEKNYLKRVPICLPCSGCVLFPLLNPDEPDNTRTPAEGRPGQSWIRPQSPVHTPQRYTHCTQCCQTF